MNCRNGKRQLEYKITIDAEYIKSRRKRIKLATTCQVRTKKMILQDVDEDLNPQKVGGAAEAL
mgnify:CR=1 FL=1